MKPRESSPNREQGTRGCVCVCVCESARGLCEEMVSLMLGCRGKSYFSLFLSFFFFFFFYVFLLCVYFSRRYARSVRGVCLGVLGCAWVCLGVLGCAWVSLVVPWVLTKKARIFLRASRSIKIVLCTLRYVLQ